MIKYIIHNTSHKEKCLSLVEIYTGWFIFSKQTLVFSKSLNLFLIFDIFELISYVPTYLFVLNTMSVHANSQQTILVENSKYMSKFKK